MAAVLTFETHVQYKAIDFQN